MDDVADCLRVATVAGFVGKLGLYKFMLPREVSISGRNGAAGKGLRHLSLRRRARFTVGTVGHEAGRRGEIKNMLSNRFALPFRST